MRRSSCVYPYPRSSHLLKLRAFFRDVLQDVPAEYRAAFQVQLRAEAVQRARVIIIANVIAHIPIIYFIDIRNAFDLAPVQRLVAALLHASIFVLPPLFVWLMGRPDIGASERRSRWLFAATLIVFSLGAQGYVWLTFVQFQHTIMFALEMFLCALIIQIPRTRDSLLFYITNFAFFCVIVTVYPDDPLRRADNYLSGVFTIAMAWLLAQVMIKARAAAFVNERLLERERLRSDELLLNILPAPIAARLKEDPHIIADYYPAVTILFADIVGFTPLAAVSEPVPLVTLLDDLFSRFDALAEHYGLEKIKTIGDAYMAVGGVPVPRPDHAECAAALALGMREAIAQFNREHPELCWQVRIGLHSGGAVAGVIGRRKFSYDLWGDTVNTASRMETEGVPGRIQMSDATRRLVDGRFICEPRGGIDVKGKGKMEVWFLEGMRV